ncbi:MAG: GNAT family N-acetyltransferase [Christensenellales bacterium]|jgi:predicted acetyltransferase
MEIRRLDIPGRDRKDAVRAWKDGFPEDSGAFIDAYFSMRASLGESWALYDDGLCAVAHVIPQKLAFDGKTVRSACIAGVSTLSDKRYKGYASVLMRHLHERLRQEGLPVAFLSPFLHSFYEKLDYVTAYFTKKIVLERENFPREDSSGLRVHHVVTRENFPLMQRAYAHYMRRFDGYVLREASDFRWMLKDAELDGAGVQLIEDTQGYSGYAVFTYSAEEKTLEIVEWCAPQHLFDALLTALMPQDCRRVIYRVPVHRDEPDAEPGQMLLALEESAGALMAPPERMRIMHMFEKY